MKQHGEETRSDTAAQQRSQQWQLGQTRYTTVAASNTSREIIINVGQV